MERIRTQLRQEIEDLTVDLEKVTAPAVTRGTFTLTLPLQANAALAGYDKRVLTLDKTVREWEQRYGELSKKVLALEDVSRPCPNRTLYTSSDPLPGTAHGH